MDLNTDDGSLLLRFQRSMSLDPDDYSTLKGGPWSANKRRMIRSTILSLIFGLVGWYYPRYLIAHETQIKSKQPPYQETAAGDVILDFTLNEPLIDPPTIPGPFLVFTSVWVPIGLIMAYVWLTYWKTSFYWMEVTTAISAFSTSIGLCEGTTQLLKLFVQRRRPNFYALCAFGKATKECTADLKHIREANFSFPSGHSSLSCGGMTFLVLYFVGKWSQRGGGGGNGGSDSTKPSSSSSSSSVINCLGGTQQPSNNMMLYFLTAAIPWGWTLFVAASRLVDKWHHPSDVVAGLGLGFATVSLMYHVWYPPCISLFAGVPRVLLQELDRSSMGVSNYDSKLPTFSD